MARIVEQLFSEKLGSLAPLITRSLASSKLKRNTVPVNNLYLVCDPNKVRRAQQCATSTAVVEDERKLDGVDITGLGYDGQKDKTRAMLVGD